MFVNVKMTCSRILNRVDTGGRKGYTTICCGESEPAPFRNSPLIIVLLKVSWELPLNCDLGRALKRLRSERGMTQKDLAARVDGGLDYTYIGKIERGEQLPSLKILMSLGDALGVPVSHFFQEESPAANSPLRVAESDVKSLELHKELRQLHPDDIPLVVEIVRVLNRHRKADRKRTYQPANENLPLAAEDGPTYRKS